MSSQVIEIVAYSDRLHLEWVDTFEIVPEQFLHLQRDLYQRFNSPKNDWLLALGFCSEELEMPPTLIFWSRFSKLFVESLIHLENLEIIREKASLEWDENLVQDLLAELPLFRGSEYVTLTFLASEWIRLNKVFSREISAFDGSVADFIYSYSPNLQLAGRIYFHLVESKKEGAPFAFLATYSTATANHVSVHTGMTKHLPLKHALQEFKGDDLLNLLSTVYRAARESSFLKSLIDSGEIFHPLAWDEKDAFKFLNEVTLYEQSGVLCRIPNWWNHKISNPVVSISIGDNEMGFVGLDALLECKPSLAINGIPITEEEALALIGSSDGLSQIKNKWIAVDKEKLEQALAAYKKAQQMLNEGNLTFQQAMNFQLAPEKFLGTPVEMVEFGVSQGEWLAEITKKLLNPEVVDEVSAPSEFRADLRPYQQIGLNWLGLLDSLGLGACLADDMGLGKTVQILAFLSYKRQKKIHTLLVVPASLVANWAKEIEKFCPNIKYLLAHPDYLRSSGINKISNEQIQELDLVITTYSMTQRYDVLKEFSWDYLILDEAQAIKNPGTKQAIEIKKYIAKNRIILTGTPVENHLGDLWSLFDFLNPGLLGSLSEFGNFVKKLKENQSGYARLRNVISPYILRRMKTDKRVIDDLPDKIEMKSYAELSKKQTVLYNQLIDELKKALESSEGITRKGLVLGTLVKFKQLCNHPDQFLGVGDYLEEDSGKFKRLKEIFETILEKREKALIFTQFKELVDPLHNFLSRAFSCEGLVLHGSIAVKKRKEIVDQFQQKNHYLPFMILSLKAGGVGLNLTEANHVIHFDRWWNPAVENQATDRAFRIGQQKNVVVHKFITQGTIEEKIDQMLEAKTKLSDEIINSGAENKITELKDQELLEFFRLRTFED